MSPIKTEDQNQSESLRQKQLATKKVNVFGLGYVGNVTALSLARLGHHIIGIEVVEEKIQHIRSGKLPIYEPGLETLLHKAQQEELQGKFFVENCLNNEEFDSIDGSIVCVGTPSLSSGEVDLSQIKATLTTIARAIKNSNSWHNVIIRSTIPPGTTENLLIPLLEKESQKKAGVDFGVGFYPEFLREGKGLEDFIKPSLNVVGCLNEQTIKFLQSVFSVDTPLKKVDFRTAEMIKYVNNSFHALKVTFANEIGTLCQAYKVNSDELIDLFLSDKVLNISPYYLRPGFAFGGACLPKEVRATSALLLKKGLKGEVINSILPSNEEHLNRLVTMIQEKGVHKIGFLGVAFKPDTDDIRESALLRVIDTLIKLPSYKERLQIKICDHPFVVKKLEKNYNLSQICFTNEAASLLNDVELVILGPYRLTKEEIIELSKFSGEFIDLRWFKLPKEITQLKKYYPFC